MTCMVELIDKLNVEKTTIDPRVAFVETNEYEQIIFTKVE